jgi:hypothetical protein
MFALKLRGEPIHRSRAELIVVLERELAVWDSQNVEQFFAEWLNTSAGESHQQAKLPVSCQ